MEWKKELNERCRRDDNYQHWLGQVRRLEADFFALRASLTEDRRSVLDAYLAACEEMDHAQLHVAYELGKRCIT